MIENQVVDSQNDMKEILRQCYLDLIEEEKEYIQQDKEWISALNRFREKYQHNWKIVETARELIWHHVKSIQGEMAEIETLRKTINELS